jgi:hypothetical protein
VFEVWMVELAEPRTQWLISVESRTCLEQVTD